MKWITQLVVITILSVAQSNPGCQTTSKRHHKTQAHSHPKKHTKVTAVGDDAAIKAIIKSLRE